MEYIDGTWGSPVLQMCVVGSPPFSCTQCPIWIRTGACMYTWASPMSQIAAPLPTISDQDNEDKTEAPSPDHGPDPNSALGT